MKVGTQTLNRERDTVSLYASNWDDYWKYETLFSVSYIDHEGREHSIGGTKIGQFGLRGAAAQDEPRVGYRRPSIPDGFLQLPPDFFSLGQDASFYVNLQQIGNEFTRDFLKSIRDVSFDTELLESALQENVMKVSLLREVPITTLTEQFSRIASGGAMLTPFNFSCHLHQEFNQIASLSFNVAPSSVPPSNIHVLIGRNGVGKSTFLNNVAKVIVASDKPSADDALAMEGTEFSNLVSVSFSAFDAFEPISVPQDRTKRTTYHYVGLKKIASRRADSGLKDHSALQSEMTRSVRTCLIGPRRTRWLRAINILSADPIFSDAGLALLDHDADPDDVQSADASVERIGAVFKRLSSGHKIVLLTITRLIETVVEKSLVLLDEPEAHLHPPLLSAFVRALSDLLTDRNGVAIIATHSPVVLQEVPRECVWRMHRTRNLISVERPLLETFGENVGTLTDEVFGLEVTATGFHTVLARAAELNQNYEEALASLGNQLGTEGRAVLRARIASMNHQWNVEH